MRPRLALIGMGALVLVTVGLWAHLLSFIPSSSGSTRATVTSASRSPRPSPTPVTTDFLGTVQATHGRDRPVALVIGDDMADGGTAGSARDSYPRTLGRLVDWHMVVYAVDGAGYVNAGPESRGPFAAIATVHAVKAVAPDVIIVQGGLNDLDAPSSDVAKAVSTLVDQLRTGAPDARIIVLGALWPSRQLPSTLPTVREAIRRSSMAPGVRYVDTARWHFAAAPDGVHPTAKGSRHIASRLVAALIGGLQP